MAVWSPVEKDARRGQAEHTSMSASVILIVLTRSGPRSRTFFHTANSSSRTPAEAGGRPPPRPSGFVYTFEGPHRPMTPPERSSQPRDQRHRALSLWHPVHRMGVLGERLREFRPPWPRSPRKRWNPQKRFRWRMDSSLTRAVPARRGKGVKSL